MRLFLYVPGNGLSAYDITGSSISGVNDIEAVPDGYSADYYNLQGIKIPYGNLTPGIYIKKQGQKATKILIK